MLNEIIITIVVAIVGALGAVVTRYVVPWLTTKTTAEQRALATSVIESVVRAAYAEGVKRGWNGDSQKAWAIARAKEIFGVDLTDAQYDLIRKAIVQEVKGIAMATQ
jgi:type II secretory pathway pseudopilin PulG